VAIGPLAEEEGLVAVDDACAPGQCQDAEPFSNEPFGRSV
jgi:hypothetical protein